MTKYSGVYKILNVVNNKIYVGSSVDIASRWRQHKLLLRKNKHHNAILQNAWRKYGKDAFEFSVLELVEPCGVISKEQWYMDWLKPEYNLAPVAGSTIGRKASYETKKQMSESRTGTGNGFFGKKHSEETKRKLSEYRLGKSFKPHSDETKQKMSDSAKGIKNGFFGKKHSDVAKGKISQAGTGRIFSPEAREKQSEKIRGERSYNASLTNNQVEEIRRLWKEGNCSQVEIGTIFGVSNKVVNSIVNFRTWKKTGGYNFA